MSDSDSDSTTEPPQKKPRGPIRRLWVVIDLETTGFSKSQHEIIEIAGVILDDSGETIDDSAFSSFVKPNLPIPYAITQLTGIQNKDVANEPPFSMVGYNFFVFIFETNA